MVTNVPKLLSLNMFYSYLSSKSKITIFLMKETLDRQYLWCICSC